MWGLRGAGGGLDFEVDADRRSLGNLQIMPSSFIFLPKPKLRAQTSPKHCTLLDFTWALLEKRDGEPNGMTGSDHPKIQT